MPRIGPSFRSGIISIHLIQFEGSQMAQIEAFRAFRYDTARVALADVVTQPYDKITPEMQDRYYAASPYNLVRIILGKQHAGGHPGENSYTRASEFFRDWRRQGIVFQEQHTSIYVSCQLFAIHVRY